MEARELNDHTDEPGLQAAFAALDAELIEEALTQFQRLLPGSSAGSPKAHAGLGLSFMALDRHAEALPHLQHAWNHGVADERVGMALMRTCLALDHFEAAAQLGRVLAHPPRSCSSRAITELRNLDSLMRSRLEAPGHFKAGRFDLLHTELPDLLACMPRWAEGWALVAATHYEMSPSLGPAMQAAAAASIQGTLEFEGLNLARQVDLQFCAAAAERGSALAPQQRLARVYRARAHFSLGLEPHAEDLAVLPKPDEVGFQTLGPLPLRAGADCPEAQKTVPPECITVLQPRGFGADVEWAPGIGVTQSAAGYALCLDDAEARGASDLVIRADGTALHDTLCHPLAALANVVHDKAILLRARDRVLVRRARTDISIGDEAVTLLGVSTKQFGHWLFEHLPRLRHLEGLLDLQRAVYLVDAGMPETHLQALRWVIRAEPAIHHVEPECGVRVPSLWVGGRDVFFPYYVHQSVSSSVHIAPAHAPSLQWLRKRLTEGRGLQAPCRRLFVRRGTGLRSMNNQDEIESHLVRHWGFEVVQPELLDFEQQSRLFAEATWVIGPHGSALSNAVACPPGTRMLTLFNGQPGNLPSWAAALEALGIRHAFLAGQADTGSHPVRHHWRFRIDLAALDEAMSAMASLKA